MKEKGRFDIVKLDVIKGVDRMYRKVEDFLVDWKNEADGTSRVLAAMTDDKLEQAIVQGHNTLGWLGWHLATSPALFAGLVGLDVKANSQQEIPDKVQTILDAYKKIVNDIQEAVEQQLTNELLNEEVESFGLMVPRGALLKKLVDHQTHHRGQMTVLLRQAGLTVPGVLGGPTKEESN